MRFGSQEGTLSCFSQPSNSLVCFANQEGTLARIFGSQKGILAHMFQQLGHEVGPRGGATRRGDDPPPLVHITVSLYTSFFYW